jgi:hypothetical protein
VVQSSACGGSPVQSVDVEKRTIAFGDKVRPELAGKTFAVAEDALITIDGKRGKLADVPGGAFVTLNLAVDQRTVRGLDAQGPLICDCGGTLIKAVDVEKGTITLDDKARPGLAGRTIAVAADARISIENKPGKLTEVPADAFVTFRLSVDQQTIRALDAQGPMIFDCGGTPIKAVDAEKGTITFDDKVRPDLAGKTFPLVKDARVSIEHRPAKLADVPADAFVYLQLSVDRKMIRTLDAQGPQINDHNGSLITAVDAEKRTVTFDDKCRPEVAGKTFSVAPDAGIVIDGKRATLADLPAGAFVNIGLAVDRKTIRHLSAQGAQISDCNGVCVESIDGEKRTIAFGDKVRADLAGKTFLVASDAWVSVDGKPGKLSDVPAGSFVNLSFAVDRKTVSALAAQGPSVPCGDAVVKSVDAEKGTLTVADRTYPVAKHACIAIDGKFAKLADVPPGAKVGNLRLCVDQKTLGVIGVSAK